MAWTWTEIQRLALVRSGRVGPGQPVNPQQQAVAADALALLLDELDGKGLALPAFSSLVTFTCVAGQAKYLLGVGVGAASTTRPESIIDGTVTITNSPVVNVAMVEMSYPDYTLINVPSTTGQPWNYALNPKYPQSEVWLYPTPAQTYVVNLNCKIKWIDTVGDPATNPFAVASVPSGYPSALVDILTLRIAQIDRLQTETMEAKYKAAIGMLTHYVANQDGGQSNGIPAGLFSWNILTAGRNP